MFNSQRAVRDSASGVICGAGTRRAFCKAERRSQRLDLWRVSSALSLHGDVPHTHKFTGIRRNRSQENNQQRPDPAPKAFVFGLPADKFENRPSTIVFVSTVVPTRQLGHIFRRIRHSPISACQRDMDQHLLPRHNKCHEGGSGQRKACCQNID